MLGLSTTASKPDAFVICGTPPSCSGVNSGGGLPLKDGAPL